MKSNSKRQCVEPQKWKLLWAHSLLVYGYLNILSFTGQEGLISLYHRLFHFGQYSQHQCLPDRPGCRCLDQLLQQVWARQCHWSRVGGIGSPRAQSGQSPAAHFSWTKNNQVLELLAKSPVGVEAVAVAAEVKLAEHNGKVVFCCGPGFPEGAKYNK